MNVRDRYATPEPQQIEPSEVTIDGDDGDGGGDDWYEQGGENMAASNGGAA